MDMSMAQIQPSLNALAARFDGFVARCEDRWRGDDKKHDSNTAKLDHIEDRCDAHGNRMTALETQNRANTAQIAGLAKKVEGIDRRLTLILGGMYLLGVIVNHFWKQ